jgi:plasmid stability protein
MTAMQATLSLLADLWYSRSMATITIRNLDEKVKRELQIRAAVNGRSMEAEAREILSGLVKNGQSSHTPDEEEDLGTAIHRRFAALGGVELQIPPRQFSGRPIPRFKE